MFLYSNARKREPRHRLNACLFSPVVPNVTSVRWLTHPLIRTGCRLLSYMQVYSLLPLVDELRHATVALYPDVPFGPPCIMIAPYIDRLNPASLFQLLN